MPDDVAKWGAALRQFVEFEDANGRWETIKEYHPASSKCVDLNYAIPSIYGDVDVDWMLRIAPVAKVDFAGWLAYRAAKFYWNMTDPRRGKPWENVKARLNPNSILTGSNSRAPLVAHAWMSGKTLRELFLPALQML